MRPLTRNATLLTILTLLLAGCNSPGLPAAKKIQFIHITAVRLPQEKEPAVKPREAKLVERKDIVEVMDWLHTIDWSQAGQDLAAIRLPAADGRITLTQ